MGKTKKRGLYIAAAAVILILLLWTVFGEQTSVGVEEYHYETPETGSGISLCTDTVSEESFGKFNENYVNFDANGISCEGYRIAGDSENGALFCISTPEKAESYDLLEGSFGNTAPVYGMQGIRITYKSDNYITVTYGNDRNSLSEMCILPAQQDYAEQEVSFLADSSFFRISCSKGKAHVADMYISCGGSSSDETENHELEGIRYVPETDYDPYEGETLSIPVINVEDDGTYSVMTEWKSYTYHSFEYCRERILYGGEDPEDYALTEPVDVANYFILFNSIPANYGICESNAENWEQLDAQENVPTGEEAAEVFGYGLSRYVQVFSRDDGYVTAVDYEEYDDSGLPLYYEFDFDMDGTYGFTKRGVGRVVGWVGGFSCYDDKINAATITTDHYYAFGEYSNCGFFNPYFDAMSTGKTGLSFAKSYEIADADISIANAA